MRENGKELHMLGAARFLALHPLGSKELTVEDYVERHCQTCGRSYMVHPDYWPEEQPFVCESQHQSAMDVGSDIPGGGAA